MNDVTLAAAETPAFLREGQVMAMPTQFWLLSIPSASIIWDRTIMGFVPAQPLFQKAHKADLQRCWFLTEEEAQSQAGELRALGVQAQIVSWQMG